MPRRGIFSTGLPRTQPTARPIQAPRTRSRVERGMPGARGAVRAPAGVATIASQSLGSSATPGSGRASSSASSSSRQGSLLAASAISGDAPA